MRSNGVLVTSWKAPCPGANDIKERAVHGRDGGVRDNVNLDLRNVY